MRHLSTRRESLVGFFLGFIVFPGVLNAGSAPAAASAFRVEAFPSERRILVSVAEEGLVFTPGPKGETIELAGAGLEQVSPGSPDLPVIRLTVRVDEDFRAETVRVVSAREIPLGSHRLRAATGAESPAAPDPALGPASERPFVPEHRAVIEGEGWLRGRRLLYLALFPVRVKPGADEVVLATRLELELAGHEEEPRGIHPRPVPWEFKVEESLARLVVDLRLSPRERSIPPPAAESQVWSPTFRPTNDGSPVEYVIVTSEAMRPALEVLANWKTGKGVQAVVRTTEWITATYPGVDRAEQIRSFLDDAYRNWGTLWVLLGGDTDVIPVRFGTHAGVDPPVLIPTDLYYSCLDGNWNGDGDAAFGEGVPPGEPSGGDYADLNPEVFVGRAPILNPTDATTFVNKVLDYEKAAVVNSLYPASALLLGEMLSPSTDGALLCEEARMRLPASMRVVRMYENYQAYSPPPVLLPETRNTVFDSLKTGFGLVHHVGHGYRNTMAVGDGTLNNTDADNLTNGDRLSIIYAINCASAAMDFNSIGERFLKNPNGGAVAYIGSSRISIAGEDYRLLQNEFYDVVFQDSVLAIGQGLALSKVPFVGGAQYETTARWLQFAVNLLGDPELPVWNRAPQAITATHSPTFVLGSSGYSLNASVGGSPLAGARVALVKSNTPPTSLDAYMIATTLANGSASVPFNPQYVGNFTVTVTRPGYKPYESTANVLTTSEPFVHFNQVAVNDDTIPPSSGNNNGIPDAGETLEVTVRLQNSGGSQATGVAATLSVLAGGEYLNIMQNTATYATLVPGGQSNGSNSYVVEFDPSATEAYQPLFRITMTSVQRSWTDTFVLPVYGIELEHYGHELTDPAPGGNNNGVPEAGEAVSYRVTARNNGTGRADAVAVTLRVLRRSTMQPDPLVTVTDGSASFGNLVPGVIVQGDPVAFTLGPAVVVSDLLVELSWRDSHGARGIGFSDLTPPATVPEIWATGHSSSISLTWPSSPSSDVRGYDILRSSSAGGPFVRVNGHTTVGSAVYEDAGLPPLTRYYYKVVARDSSFSASVPSPFSSVTTSPPLATGWPIETGQEGTSGIVLDDIDRNGDFELVVGSDAIYAWHHDGTELRDGDGNPSTSGVFSPHGQNSSFGFQATPAIADLTGDNDFEIIGVAWRQAKVYVWNQDGSLEPGWPQVIGGDFNWASPAVEDLDLDGDLEIVVASGFEGKIFAWHDDGTEVADGDANPQTNGVLFLTNSSFVYSSPAVGNIDGDSFPEIVFGTQGGHIYALSRTGAVKPGWPVMTLGQITASPALADLDGNNQNEVVIASEVDSVYVLRGNGTNYPGWPKYASVNSSTGHTSSPVVADLDSNGTLDIIFAANNGHMHAWNRDGQVLAGWSSVLFAQGALGEDATQATPSVADVDGDGQLEILLGAEDKLIYGWNHDGTDLAGFPLSVGGEVRGGTSAWDLDLDGLMELFTITYDRLVYVWDLPGRFRGDRVPWPFFRHDARNTGRFSADYLTGVEQPAPAPTLLTPALYPPYPNPFNPVTTIRFRVPGETGAARAVKLAVYDVQGRLVRRLIDGPVETGEQAVEWDGQSERGGHAASGAYFLKFETDGQALTSKLVLLK